MIAKRVAKAAEELTYSDQFDCIVVNDDLKTAVTEAKTGSGLHRMSPFIHPYASRALYHTLLWVIQPDPQRAYCFGRRGTESLSAM